MIKKKKKEPKKTKKFNHKKRGKSPFHMDAHDLHDMDLEAQCETQADLDKMQEEQRSTYREWERRKKRKHNPDLPTPRNMFAKGALKKLHSQAIQAEREPDKVEKEAKNSKRRKRARIASKTELQKKLDTHLQKGGSLKDQKAKDIMKQLNWVSNDYTQMKELRKVKYIKSGGDGTKDIPSILDFGITYTEARFVTEYVKDYDEVRAARAAKLISNTTPKKVQDEIINETLSNPNVFNALQSTVREQIQRTLITSDRTLSHIAKIAFCDPIDMFKDDGSGALKDVKDIPPVLRSCISEMTHKSVYSGRGEDREVTGHITKIKLHDSLKALQILLKDIRDKTKATSQRVNLFQFNSYGPSGSNIQDRIKGLSNEELDVLLKLANQGVENTEEHFQKKLPLPESTEPKDPNEEVIDLNKNNLTDGTQLYEMDELKQIEREAF